MSAPAPIRTMLILLLSGLLALGVTACGSSITDSKGSLPEGAEGLDPPGLVITNLVCQLDPPTLSATAVGGISNTLSVVIPDITPVVTWLDSDGAILSSNTGPAIDRIQSGEMMLFSIPALLQDGMTACRIELSGASPVPVTGEFQAEAQLTSELAR